MTKFFGDEPPLLRLYLKNLGYEKYAAIFEEAKIGRTKKAVKNDNFYGELNLSFILYSLFPIDE